MKMTASVARDNANSRDSRVYLAVLLGMAAQLIAQFLLQRLFAQYFGTSLEKDAYGFAMTLPMHVSAAVTGALAPVLIPMLGRSDATSARSMVGTVFALTLISTTLLAIVFWWQSVAIIQLQQPGLSAEKLELTASIFRILIWLLPANATIGLLYAVLHANLRFVVPALAGVLGPATTVCIVWWCGADEQISIETVARATLAGAGVSILLQLPVFMSFVDVPRIQGSLMLLRSFAALGTPVMLSSIILKVDPFIDRYLVSSLPDGDLARLDYALNIANAFIILSSGTLSTVAFPRISKKSIHGAEELQAEVAAAVRTLVRLIVPAAAVLLLFSHQLIADLFQTGKFTAEDTAAVGTLVKVFALLLLGASLGELCAKVMYAMQQVRIPLLVTALAIGTGGILKILIVPHWGIISLVAVTSTVFVAASLVQLCVIYKLVGSSILSGMLPAFLRAAIATGAACGVGLITLAFDFRFSSLVGLLFGGIAYLAVLTTIDPEVWLVTKSISRSEHTAQDREVP